MALQDLTPGSQARSQILNENFHYLNDLITQLNTTVSGLQNSFNTQIENTRQSLQSNIDTVNNKANNAQTTANKALNGVNSCKAYIVQIGGDSERGYIVYSNKYSEQWGITGDTVGGNNQTGTPSKEFKDTTYQVQASALFVNGESNDDSVWVIAKAKNKITFHLSNDGSGSAPTAKIMWRATGYIK